MALIIQQLINGLALGAVYALVALGYTLVYGIIELINFAHGDIFMLGAFIAITVFDWLHINANSQLNGFQIAGALLLVTIITMLGCAIIGVILERVAYRPLRRAPRLAPLISAIGASLVFEDIGRLWKGNVDSNFPQIFPNSALTIAGVTIRSVDVFVLFIALLLMIGLQALIQRTKMGRAMRATAQDREAASLMGVNVDRTIVFTFFIGAALAGAAAVIYGLKIGTVRFDVGFQLGLIAFTAAVLGGIGNLVGAMVGGLVVGVVEVLGTQLISGRWSLAIVFAILILILVFKPSGLLGQQVPEKV